ncbi:MAG: pyridoxamine 5'-phosphate oxidase family protein [Protaetiibacter sp.]
MLSEEVIECFDRAVLCWLASADEQGRPSVSPKEIFVVTSPEELLIADIASPRSVRNIGRRGAVCVAAIDVFEQRGYQVYGDARIVPATDPGFESLSEPLRAKAGPDFPIRSVIVVQVARFSPILAPSLWMFPDVSRSARRAGVLAAYGVRDAPSGGLA